jgi:hypothetical protein
LKKENQKILLKRITILKNKSKTTGMDFNFW